MSEQKLAGKVALVAGGAKNLGGLISSALAKQGAKIVVHCNSDSTKDAAAQTVAAIKQAGGDAFAIQGNFTRVADVERVFAEAKKQFGGIDIAVNTIGKVLKKPIVETTEAEYDSLMAIFSARGRKAPERQRQGRHHCDFVAGRVHRPVFDLCRRQGARGSFHPRGCQGIRRTRHLGQQRWARANGHAVLLPRGDTRLHRLS